MLINKYESAGLICMYVCGYVSVRVCACVYVGSCVRAIAMGWLQPPHMGWLRLVGSLNYMSLLQKRPFKKTIF